MMAGVLVLVMRMITAFALLGFLGWAFYILWREYQGQLASISMRKIPKIEIIWNQDEKAQARLFSVSELIIGRDPHCGCPIPNDTISARHARLSFHHNQWWLEDLTSTNGTFLNQERINEPTVITSGDEVRCGQVNLTVSLKDT